MKCRISLIALISMLSATQAVSVDYYPHDPHAHHAHHAHVKYIEPAHVKPVNYIEPAPLAPVYKHIPAPVKYVQPALAPVEPVYKQIHAAPVKYVHQEPHHVKYVEKPHYVKHVEYDEPAHYAFGYDVHDHQTGDVKSHTEKRDGDTVHGRYEVLDPDGFKRIVEYTADEHNGFNAVVRREPVDVKVIKKVYEPEVVKHIAPAPVKYFTPSPYPEQPILTATPKYYAQPVQKVVAPIIKQYTTPQYYAPPEHPKFFKPVEKVTKFVKPAYDYDPHHTAVKYVQPPHYNHY